MGTDYQCNNIIPQSHWACQCSNFKQRLTEECDEVYSIGLPTLMRKQVYQRKPGGYYADVHIDINDNRYSTQLYCWKIGEIKKVTQPRARLDRIGSATFPEQSIIRDCEICFIEFRFKDDYKQELSSTDSKQSEDPWFQSWAANGIMEYSTANNINYNKYEYKPFVALNFNPHYGGLNSSTTLQLCEERIEVNIYIKKEIKINTLKINGISLIQDQQKTAQVINERSIPNINAYNYDYWQRNSFLSSQNKKVSSENHELFKLINELQQKNIAKKQKNHQLQSQNNDLQSQILIASIKSSAK